MSPLAQIIAGSFLLSLVHASNPNLWKPLVAMAQAQRWSRRQTLQAAAVAALANCASTILLGALIGWLGHEFYHHHPTAAMKWIGPFLFIMLGLVYLAIDVYERRFQHAGNAVYYAAFFFPAAPLVSIAEDMFFYTCVEIEFFYFTAGSRDLLGIMTVTLIYFVVTTIALIVLVDSGWRGKEAIRWRILKNHSKAVTGWLLVLLGYWLHAAS